MNAALIQRLAVMQSHVSQLQLELETLRGLARQEVTTEATSEQRELCFENCIATALQFMRGVTRDQLLSRNRDERTAYARMLAMWLMRQCGYGLKTIGQSFRRDHCAVINAIRRIEHRIPKMHLTSLKQMVTASN